MAAVPFPLCAQHVLNEGFSTRSRMQSRFVERGGLSFSWVHERRWNKSHFRNSKNQPMPLVLPSSALHSDLPASGRAAPKPKPFLSMTSVCLALMGASLGLLPDLNPPGDVPRWRSLRFRTIYVNRRLFPAVCFISYSNICSQISHGLKSGCCLLLCCFEAN